MNDITFQHTVTIDGKQRSTRIELTCADGREAACISGASEKEVQTLAEALDKAGAMAIQALLDEYHDRHGVVFETCAEPALTGDAVLRTGCVSAVDLTEMGLPVPDTGTNPQGRGGCLCLSCKTELLTCKAQCPHGCLYCYWRS